MSLFRKYRIAGQTLFQRWDGALLCQPGFVKRITVRLISNGGLECTYMIHDFCEILPHLRLFWRMMTVALYLQIIVYPNFFVFLDLLSIGNCIYFWAA